MDHRLPDLLLKNREWARSVEARTPGFFTSLLKQQAPQYLWIGCADSRVPANEKVLMSGLDFERAVLAAGPIGIMPVAAYTGSVVDKPFFNRGP